MEGTVALPMAMDARVDTNDFGARSIMLIRLSIILEPPLTMPFIRLIILLMIYFIDLSHSRRDRRSLLVII